MGWEGGKVGSKVGSKVGKKEGLKVGEKVVDSQWASTFIKPGSHPKSAMK